MAKRLYLTNSAPAYTPPTNRGAWDDTASSPVNVALLPTKNGAYAQVSGSVVGFNPSNYDTRFINAVADVKATGTLSGTVSFCLMTEDLGSGDAYYHVHAWVSQGATDTLRGTVLSDYIGVENWSAVDNREGIQVLDVPLTPLAVTAGDKLKIEIGIRDRDTQIFHTTSVRIGYGGTSSADLTDADTATNHPGWFQLTDPAGVFTDPIPVPPDPGGEAEGDGGPLLPYDLPDGKLLVEVAWGADLADPDSWSWSDITCKVRSGLDITIGRNDEFSTASPAGCTFTVDNADNMYSLGPLFPNYPNVKQNTPVRVRARADSTKIKTLFQGYVAEFTPGWAGDMADQPICDISASGMMRRLEQSKDTLQGSIRRHLSAQPFVTDWWPLDDGDGTTNGHNEILQNAPVSTNPFTDPSTGDTKGDVRWGGDSDYPATSQAVTLSNQMLLCCPITAPRYDEDGVWFFYTAVKYESDDLLRIKLGSDSILGTGLNIELNPNGALIVEYFTFTTGPTLLFSHQLAAWDGVWNHLGIYYDQVTTGDVFLVVNGVIIDSAAVPALLTMRPGVLWFKSDGDSNVSVSNVVIFNDGTDHEAEVAAIGAAYDAHIGETPVERVVRLGVENNIPVNVFGTSTTTMGPQPIGTILNAFRDCESAELGFLFDGITAGLTFVSRSARENPTATLTVDARELSSGLKPTSDDQRLLNKVTASRPNGGSATFEDEDGPRGTLEVGVYDDSVEANCQADRSLLDYASWMVRLGTVEGYRYPQVSLNFRTNRTLASDAMEIVPSGVISVTELAANVSGIADESVTLVVEGYQISIPSPLEWTTEYNCSPASPWNVALLAENRTDTGEYFVHLDTEGSQLNSSAALGATSLSVATTSGPLWTTSADDFPFQVEILGIPITVTNITGASSPQTFTVTGVTKALASGSAVHSLAPVIAL